MESRKNIDKNMEVKFEHGEKKSEDGGRAGVLADANDE